MKRVEESSFAPIDNFEDEILTNSRPMQKIDRNTIIYRAIALANYYLATNDDRSFSAVRALEALMSEITYSQKIGAKNYRIRSAALDKEYSESMSYYRSGGDKMKHGIIVKRMTRSVRNEYSFKKFSLLMRLLDEIGFYPEAEIDEIDEDDNDA